MSNYKSTYKSTDNEIVKALCEMTERGFETISYVDLKKNGINVITITDILDLISRLQAGNDGLQKLVNLSIDTQNDLTDKLLQAEENLKTVKAEAYKECIEKVYKFICDTQNWGVLHREFLENGECYWLKQKFDNLLKELVGEDK